MRNILLYIVIIGFVLTCGCTQPQEDVGNGADQDTRSLTEMDTAPPRIASWLAKKDEISSSGNSYDLVMTGWFTPDEAMAIRASNPDAILLAGLTTSWVWANDDWITFLETVASYGRDEELRITDDMYLKKPDGSKCAFGWASEEWGHEEIYAMDPRDPEWAKLITSFYKTVLEQPQHDGIIVDMVTEKQYWCPDAISDEEWLESTKAIMAQIDQLNTEDKPVIFNAGKELADIDEYGQFMDGYLMENFLGSWGADYETGLKAADGPYIVIYAVDTDDTGIRDMKRMRLGLTLSMLNDNTYFTYDVGPRDHGHAWWFSEYDANPGTPLGDYYEIDGAYRRDFDKGTVVSSPDVDVIVVFDQNHTDVTTGITSRTFSVEGGDGRVFIRSGQ